MQTRIEREVRMIYILEDDDNIRKLVLYALRTNGFEAESFDRPDPF